jgi:prolyl-tRNA editing enzyme YbaK/EbsC (Cys-tRNA(Pro) deacylase)
MMTVPASRHIDLEAISKAVREYSARPTKEECFTDLFLDCEPDAMPPFCKPFGILVFLVEIICTMDHMLFNGGTYHRITRMGCDDYVDLVKLQNSRSFIKE